MKKMDTLPTDLAKHSDDSAGTITKRLMMEEGDSRKQHGIVSTKSNN
jgi:hypothetical protein